MDERICGNCKSFDGSAKAVVGWCEKYRVFLGKDATPLVPGDDGCFWLRKGGA